MMGRCLSPVGLVLALFLHGNPFTASPVAGQTKALVIEQFDVEINVMPSGRIQVREAIRFRFTGSWNGVFRDIPVRYETPQRFNFNLDLEVNSVLDESGQPLKYEESRQGGSKRVKIWIPGANDEARTVRIEYSVENALRFIDPDDSDFEAGHDELYWNVTGDEWEIPIQAATARVQVPPEVGGLAAPVYTGPIGSTTTSNATATELESGFYFVTTESLGQREGMAISVAWAPGVIARPASYVSTVRFLRANWIFLIPVLTLILMYRLWNARGRDPSRLAVSPQYEPPEGMTPAEIGTLIDNSPDMCDITASIVDLAVRGYLKITEREQKGMASWLKGNTYSFELLKDTEEWSELTPHERKLMSGLFEGGLRKVVDLDDLEHEFYKHMTGIKDRIFNRLVKLGFYHHRPDQVRSAYIGGGIATTAFLLLGLVFVGERFELFYFPLGAVIVAAVLTAAAIIGFGMVMPARTVKGARQLEHVLGFQEFLDRVEADHFRRMIDSPEMFERYLPHAMALQVEKKWARAFEDLYKEPPDWYSGPKGRRFRPTVFLTDLAGMSHSVGSAMASQPRSSGGSGFSGGGGSSGGGFGGGGGGWVLRGFRPRTCQERAPTESMPLPAVAAAPYPFAFSRARGREAATQQKPGAS